MAARKTNPFIVGSSLTRSSTAPAAPIKTDSDLSYRSSLIERALIKDESRSIEFTFSSDVELERWPGVESFIENRNPNLIK